MGAFFEWKAGRLLSSSLPYSNSLECIAAEDGEYGVPATLSPKSPTVAAGNCSAREAGSLSRIKIYNEKLNLIRNLRSYFLYAKKRLLQESPQKGALQPSFIRL